MLAHFGYGTGAGVLYSLVHRALRPAGPVPLGPLFGAGLWVAGYAGWLPLVGLYLPPTDEPKSRVGMQIVEHLVYGTTTATAYRSLG